MSCMQFIRGMIVGLAVGSALTMAATPKKKLCGKKMLTKVLRSVTDAIDDVTEAIGL